jgi:tRNA pseudouridine38-40 synthase
MKNYKCIVQYDGTDYCGYQKQKNLPTIQEYLERALGKVYKSPITVYGSGRTDSGVHATGQVINFHAEPVVPVDRIPFALNSLLPADIVVVSAEEAERDFHARFSAIHKTYEYCIDNHKMPNPFNRRYSLHVPKSLNIEAMIKAAPQMKGTHDFSAFQAVGSSVTDSVRTIHQSRVEVDRHWIVYSVTADGFLYNMVRIIVGTLLEIGKGKMDPSEILDIIKSRDRENAGPTVFAKGLFLKKVTYSAPDGET